MTTVTGGRGYAPWLIYGALLLGAPQVFSSSGSVAVLSQMGYAIVFGLAYNMLLGQGGMLSFGHAVYAGLGAFFAAHAMNAASAGSFWLPVTLSPLIGGLTGAAFGLLFGYVTTKRSGTTFAMITLGIGELVFVSSAMFPGFFGGDTGVSTSRVYGASLMGITFGPSVQAYYLISIWVFAATLAMYAFTQTPLGRMINAVRDNPERVLFVGYNPRRVRFVTLVLSGFFAGVAGALVTLNFEIVTPETLGIAQSGAVLLFTFIGGTSAFFGPVVGAVVGTLLTISLPAYTQAWPLYLGVFFIIVVKYAPSGIVGLAMALWQLVRQGQFRRIAPLLSVVLVCGFVALLGMVLLVEMTYQLKLTWDGSTGLSLMGVPLNTDDMAPWLTAAVLLLAGGVSSVLAARRYTERLAEAVAHMNAKGRQGSAA